MRRLLQHGGEAEEITVGGLVYDDFLLVLIHGGYLDLTGHDDVAVRRWSACFEDALTRGKCCNFSLGCENAGFIVIEKFEERDVT